MEEGKKAVSKLPTIHQQLIRVVVITFIPLIVLVLVLLLTWYNNLRFSLLEHNLALAKLGANVSKTWLDGQIRILEAITATRMLQQVPLEQIPKKYLLGHLRKQPDWVNIILVEKNGRYVNSLYNNKQLLGKQFPVPLKSLKQPYVSNITHCAQLNRTIITISSPIIINNEFSGAISVCLTPESFLKMLNENFHNENADIGIWDRNKRLIVQTGITSTGASQRNIKPEYLSSGRKKTAIVYSPVTHQLALIGVAPLKNYNWSVTVSIPFFSAMAPLFLIISLTTIIVFFATGLSLFWSIRTASEISSQISLLAKRAKKIGEGYYDLSPTPTSTSELKSLSYSLCAMANNLGISHEKLEKLVKERTSELERSNRELEAFSYTVSHDLRAPLRSMDGFSSILVEEYADKLDVQALSYISRIHKASLRMAQLIDDLLRLAHITSETLNHEEVNLSKLAKNISRELKIKYPESQVEVEIEDSIIVHGDQRLLNIALENILDNAWKYSQQKPYARVIFGSVFINNESVYYVSDNGVGFNMEYVKNIFKPFHRLHSVNEYSGTGIGLATVQRIIDRHNGRIWAESTEGEGATFYFTIPKPGSSGE
ncbi:MAG: hypothetical protein A2X42_02410 [Candidatus Margulisbacteria bacterium GWF2_38_17]|nr:MAG: hypothetical protein A2X42_02410 [Candidatus Margulisbacteria bacterium GWF2_38_17]